MKFVACLRFLRPYSHKLHRDISISRQAAYLQFYSASRGFCETAKARHLSQPHNLQDSLIENGVPAISNEMGHIPQLPRQGAAVVSFMKTRGNDVRLRVDELKAAGALEYPRIHKDQASMTCVEFRKKYDFLRPDESVDGESITIRGRLYTSRTAGSKLIFFDVVQDSCKVQGICNLGPLQQVGVQPSEYKDFCRLARRGDIISITGIPSRTKSGELSLRATCLPVILTPSLASLPTSLEDKQTRIQNRHVDLLVNRRVVDTLRLRSHIIQYLRNFLIRDNFLEIQTPILADGAGGALARPFVTAPSEFVSGPLSLRIAPEIWLKRLVLGGMDRVFEIGPVFRNEGIDATHNPEFTTCEFYKSFADLEELITMTENMFSGLADHVNSVISSDLCSLETLELNLYSRPFQRIDFFPALEKLMGRKLPDLESDDAMDQLISMFSAFSIPLPSPPTLPHLLDKLSGHYLEPQCTKPTFIIRPPACLAPLAKSFQDRVSNQLVSARVELFIQGKEVANMYEEENSPFEQRRKFVQQSRWRADGHESIDESYLEALEWGLPPTGGWGCGVDRLCMLFSGASRISDVLSFGNLKNVVGLSHGSGN